MVVVPRPLRDFYPLGVKMLTSLPSVIVMTPSAEIVTLGSRNRYVPPSVASDSDLGRV